eukprot:CAMPEP_0172930512 /NCGR_PEP_ID=MMETSP1075-20121228/219025_1 /TAXON_ID=2916 /ORGANISM="Ceratium fusus, Strain PA161109" /LENGTH=585 /DNA_ID=CAMNT_0013791821 /DNA_START=515 /DNA_END=2268 /DNA_ORIENTATION=+
MVGEGTRTSCTEQALDSALTQAEASGGGRIEFNCGQPGSDEVIISIQSQKRIIKPGNYVIGAACDTAKVSLDGGGRTRLFVLGLDHNKGVRADGFSLTLQNLTLQNGFGESFESTKSRTVRDGGCIYVGTLGVLNLESVRVIGCRVGSGAVGGAIAHNTHQTGGAITNGGVVQIWNSYFARNTAGKAGGVLWCGKCQAMFDHTVFFANKQTETLGYDGIGGVAAFFVSPSVTIKKCEFLENESQGDGGALDFRRSLGVRIEDSLFKKNKALGNKVESFPTGGSKHNKGFCWCGGGAIHMRLQTEASMARCTFVENVGKQGGALRLVHTTVMAEDCTFARNEAHDWGTQYGATEGWDVGGNGGAVLHDGTEKGVTWRKCRFENNTAAYRGGGVNAFVFGGESLTVDSSHFCGNRVFPSSLAGGGLNVGGDGALAVKDSIFGGNVVPNSNKEYAQSAGWCSSAETCESSGRTVINTKIPGIAGEVSPGQTCSFKCPVGPESGLRCDAGSQAADAGYCGASPTPKPKPKPHPSPAPSPTSKACIAYCSKTNFKQTKTKSCGKVKNKNECLAGYMQAARFNKGKVTPCA